jgi:ABC-2 type transport system permease protein
MVVLVSPPFLLLIYAFALTQEVQNVSLVILNLDTGLASSELVSRFEGSPTFSAVRYVARHEDVKKAIEEEGSLAAIHIQSDFSRRLARGERAELQLILDGRRSNAAQILGGYVEEIVGVFNKEVLAENFSNRLMPQGSVIARTYFNPNFDTIWSAVPGLFAGLVATVGFMVSSLSIARERELGTFEQLLVSPLTPFEILIGKTLPALLIAILSALAMLVLGVLALGVPLEGSVALLFLAMTVYLLAIIGIGLFISSLASTQQQAIIGLFMYMVPAILLSGYATPIENMPDWLQHLTQTNPITHFIVICRGVFLKEIPALVIWHHVWPMLLISLATLSSAAWLFKKKVS